MTGGRHDLGLWLGARFLGSVADQVVLFAIPTIVYARTGSIAATGLAFAIEWIPRLASLPMWGPLVDRWGCERTYLLADGMRVLIAVFACFAPGVPSEVLPLLYGALGGLFGVFYEASFVAFEVIVVRRSPRQQLGAYQSYSQTVDQLSLIAGPGLAAVFVGWWGPSPLFAAAAASFGLSALLVTTFARRSPRAQPGSEPARSSRLAAAIRLLLGTRRLLWLTLIGFFFNLALAIAIAVTPGYLQQALGAQRSAFGYISMGAGIAGAIIFLALPRLGQSFQLQRVGIAAPLVATCGCLLMASASAVPQYAVGYVLLLSADGVLALFIRNTRAALIDEAQLGAVTGAMAFVLLGAFPLGGLVASLAGYFPDPSYLHMAAALAGTLVLLGSMFGGSASSPQALRERS